MCFLDSKVACQDGWGLGLLPDRSCSPARFQTDFCETCSEDCQKRGSVFREEGWSCQERRKRKERSWKSKEERINVGFKGLKEKDETSQAIEPWGIKSGRIRSSGLARFRKSWGKWRQVRRKWSWDQHYSEWGDQEGWLLPRAKVGPTLLRQSNEPPSVIGLLCVP